MSRLPVFVSKGQSRNPVKRELEQSVATQLAEHPQLDVIRIPNLYDLNSESESLRTLQALDEDFVIITWLYDRSTHWILDRNAVSGQVGEIQLIIEGEDDDLEDELEPEDEQDRVIDSREIPDRRIYSLSFSASDRAEDFVDEVVRIA